MTTFTYLATRYGPGNFEPREGFGPSFANSGLDSTGPVADRALRDEPEQLTGLSAAGPVAPHLHGVFEGQFAREQPRRVGRLRHQQADQIVGQQAYPQLFLDHRRRHTAQHLHPQGRFDVADVELNMPTARVERREFALGYRTGIVHRGHEHLAIDLGFAHQDLLGEASVLLGAHPVGPRQGFDPAYQVIALGERLTAAKIREARTILLKEHIDPGRLQGG